jgi:hypothetical protein
MLNNIIDQTHNFQTHNHELHQSDIPVQKENGNTTSLPLVDQVCLMKEPATQIKRSTLPYEIKEEHPLFPQMVRTLQASS